MGLSGLGCVTFSVYGLGLVSSPLGVPKVLFRHAAVRRETFGNEKFGEALALRSVLIATREAQSCGTLVGFAACLRDLLSPTWAAKILRTEFLARHRRHAAFRLRRGGARAKSSRYIAPGFVAFAGRGAQKP